MKLPAFQFYPGDWLRDGVSGCSLAAQGLWLRLMILMHDSERYGYLCNNGLPIPSAQLARRCGCGLVEFEELIAELESAGVPSCSKDGIIYSRRMTRDAELRTQNAERQRKHYDSKKLEPNGKPNANSNGNLTGASRKPNGNLTTPLQSSSSSSSSNNNSNVRADDGNSEPRKPKFTIEVYREYADYLNRAGKNIRNPAGFARSLFGSGDSDGEVQAWLDNGKGEKPKEIPLPDPKIHEAMNKRRAAESQARATK